MPALSAQREAVTDLSVSVISQSLGFGMLRAFTFQNAQCCKSRLGRFSGSLIATNIYLD